ncbi:hypothetical protein AB8880_10865 [Alphaproteobacteria bacterium LSUCC0684]
MAEQSTYDADEISLTDIAIKLWRRRGLIIALPALAGILGLIAVLAMATQSRMPIVYYLNLTGIEKGAYPNGVTFSPKDLEAPEVLAALAERTGIEDKEDLRDAINVSFSSPMTAGIIKKYNDRLGQKGLNSAEIDAINAELDEELKRATQKTARISIDYQSLGISADEGAEIAMLLPRLWAEIFTTQFRVLDNTKLSGAAQATSLSLSTSIGVLEASTYIETMIGAMEILEEDSRLSSIQTSDGITPADLRTRIVNFNNIYLSAILSRNLGTDDALTRFYQQDLLLKIEKVNEEIRGINESIQSIQQVLNGETAQPSDRPSYQSDRVQVTGDAIGDIVQLVNRSLLAEYLTQLYEDKAELIEDRADLSMQAKKINNKVEFTVELISAAQVQLDRLNESYIDLLVRARAMNRQNSGTLFQAVGEPVKIGSALPGRSLLIIALSVLIGGFVAVMLALILPPRQDKLA